MLTLNIKLWREYGILVSLNNNVEVVSSIKDSKRYWNLVNFSKYKLIIVYFKIFE